MIHHDHGYGPSGGHEAEPKLLAQCGEQGRAGNVGAWILQPLQREIEFASQAGVVEDEPVGIATQNLDEPPDVPPRASHDDPAAGGLDLHGVLARAFVPPELGCTDLFQRIDAALAGLAVIAELPPSWTAKARCISERGVTFTRLSRPGEVLVSDASTPV